MTTMPHSNRPSIRITDWCDDCGRALAALDDHADCMATEIYDEWHDRRVLSPDAVHWLATHGEPGDPQPIASGIERLRRLDLLAAAPGDADQPGAEAREPSPLTERGGS
jgi:hypothetical protein